MPNIVNDIVNTSESGELSISGVLLCSALTLVIIWRCKENKSSLLCEIRHLLQF